MSDNYCIHARLKRAFDTAGNEVDYCPDCSTSFAIPEPVIEVYSPLEMALGQKIYEDRYGQQGGVWSGVMFGNAEHVWYKQAREMIAFIEGWPA